MEDRIVRLVRKLGPLTGAELRAETAEEAFACWKAAMLSNRLTVRRVGTRFLRLDRKVDGYARLSPSILREFLTYSVVGLAEDPAGLDRKADEVLAHVRTVSRAKLALATGLVAGIAARVAENPGAFTDGAPATLSAASPATAARTAVPASRAMDDLFCVFIAGDVVYDMAHDVPRPERSTGKMVRGSDLDLVVIVDDAAPEALLRQLDEAIYQQKYLHLINPSAREEIDYVVKRFDRLREQARFDDFKKMVASKILQEGVLIHGSSTLFDAAKALLQECGVGDKLAAMEASAARHREDAERHLLSMDLSTLTGDELLLFFTADESEEFE